MTIRLRRGDFDALPVPRAVVDLTGSWFAQDYGRAVIPVILVMPDPMFLYDRTGLWIPHDIDGPTFAVRAAIHEPRFGYGDAGPRIASNRDRVDFFD